MDKIEKQNSTDSDINEQKLVPMLSLEEENKEPGVSIIFCKYKGSFINHVDRNLDFFDPLPLCGPFYLIGLLY